MGGKVWAVSKVGTGSTFTAVLPLLPVHENLPTAPVVEPITDLRRLGSDASTKREISTRIRKDGYTEQPGSYINHNTRGTKTRSGSMMGDWKRSMSNAQVKEESEEDIEDDQQFQRQRKGPHIFEKKDNPWQPASQESSKGAEEMPVATSENSIQGDAERGHLVDSNMSPRTNSIGRPVQHQMDSSPLEKVTVLIADSSSVCRQIFKQLFKLFGAEFEIFEAFDGEQALAMSATIPFGIIFMDVDLPRMNGMDAAIAMREMEVKSVIIAATANYSPTELAAVMRQYG
ncbi:hypothetical protein HDV05_003182, partial [Chytridiales sp. JEL 0842]